MLIGTFLQTVVLVIITYITDWEKHVLLIFLFFFLKALFGTRKVLGKEKKIKENDFSHVWFHCEKYKKKIKFFKILHIFKFLEISLNKHIVLIIKFKLFFYFPSYFLSLLFFRF